MKPAGFPFETTSKKRLATSLKILGLDDDLIFKLTDGIAWRHSVDTGFGESSSNIGLKGHNEINNGSDSELISLAMIGFRTIAAHCN